MPYQFGIDPRRQLVYCRVSGVFTAADVARGRDALRRNPALAFHVSACLACPDSLCWIELPSVVEGCVENVLSDRDESVWRQTTAGRPL
jgi:hypothetical protein